MTVAGAGEVCVLGGGFALGAVWVCWQCNSVLYAALSSMTEPVVWQQLSLLQKADRKKEAMPWHDM